MPNLFVKNEDLTPLFFSPCFSMTCNFILTSDSANKKTPLPIRCNRVSAGILATLFFTWDASRLKSAHLIHSFLNIYVVSGAAFA